MFKKKTLLVAFMIVSMILSNCSTVLAATVEAVNEVIEASKEEVTNETTVEEQNEVQNVEETINEVTEVLQPTEEVITENVITENVEVENVENAQEAPQEKELISVDENTNNDESVIVAKVPEIRAFSKEYVSKDGNTYEVNIVFGSNAKIPENAKISVKEFEKESKEFADAKEALVEQKAEELNLENLNMVALDISILDEKENEIEPDANVSVEIKIKSLAEVENLNDVLDTMKVQHHRETENGIKVDTVDENPTMKNSQVDSKFVVKDFSTFTITWRQNNSNRQTTIHYGYMNGNTFVEFDSQPAPTDVTTSNHAYLIYDFEGYHYAGTTYYRTNSSSTPASGGTQIKPLLRYNNGWEYKNNNDTGDSYTDCANNSHIYVVYSKDAEATQGGTAQTIIPENQPKPAAPDILKESVDNGDGTRTISLSITGHETKLLSDKLADVIVVFDTSGSMEQNMAGGTRLEVARNAINNLATKLYSYKNSAGKPQIRMALVTFNTTATIAQGLTDNENTFKSAVNRQTDGDGGTNWEQALQLANSMVVDEDRATFIIFVSDGDPTFRISRGNITDKELDIFGKDNTYYNYYYNDRYYRNNYVFGTGTNDPKNENYNAAVNQGKAIKAVKKSFYTVAFSDVDNEITKMSDLNADADGDGYYKAGDSEQLNQAFTNIAESIQGTLGWGANVDDGITGLTDLEAKTGIVGVDPDSFVHYKNNVEWDPTSEGAKKAEYVDGSVKWNLGDNFQLDDGVTYKVSFLVWPDQDAIDLITQLRNNEVQWEDVPADIQAQIDRDTSTTPYTYTLKTNTEDAGVSYFQSQKVGGKVTVVGEQQFEKFKPVGPLSLKTTTLEVKKIFNDDLTAGEDRETQVTLNLQRRVISYNEQGELVPGEWEDFEVPYIKPDGSTAHSNEIILSERNHWKAKFYISPGLETVHTINGKETTIVYNPGYEFRLTEPNQDYHYELNGEIVKPMLVNNDPQYLGDDNGDQALTAENIVKGGINIKKILVDQDNNVIKDDKTEFVIKGYIIDKEGNPYTFNNEWDNRTDKSTAEGASADWILHQNDTGAYHLYDANDNRIGYKLHFDSTGEIELHLKGGESVRFVNVPQDSQYYFYEEINNLGDGYSYTTVSGYNKTREAPTIGEDGKPKPGNFIDYEVQPTVNIETSEVTGTVYGDVQHNIDITNTTRTVDLTVTKTWNDNDDQDGIRPDDVKVQLYEVNGEQKEAVRDQVTLSETNGWNYQWENLPLMYNGNKINYTVEELPLDEDYSTTVGELQEIKENDKVVGYKIDVENKHKPEEVEVTVLKYWNDKDNQDGYRTESIQVQLYADDVATGDPVTLNEANEWNTSWKNLAKYSNGEKITYTVKEVGAEENTETGVITFNGETYTVTYGINGTEYDLLVTNTHKPEETTVTVTKVWDDKDNQDGYRPESVDIKLLADGNEVSQEGITATQTLNEDNEWTYTWEGLDKKAEGTDIVYTVEEVGSQDGKITFNEGEYTVEITGEDNNYTVTNSHEIEKIDVTVIKVWEDANNWDGYRPNSIQVQLFANGDAIEDIVTLSEDNEWTYTWEDLDQKSDGEDIVYSVEELEVPEKYTVEYSIDDDGNYIITNIQKPGEGGYEPPPENPGTGTNIFENIALYISMIIGAVGAVIFETKRFAKSK